MKMLWNLTDPPRGVGFTYWRIPLLDSNAVRKQKNSKLLSKLSCYCITQCVSIRFSQFLEQVGKNGIVAFQIDILLQLCKFGYCMVKGHSLTINETRRKLQYFRNLGSLRKFHEILGNEFNWLYFLEYLTLTICGLAWGL